MNIASDRDASGRRARGRPRAVRAGGPGSAPPCWSRPPRPPTAAPPRSSRGRATTLLAPAARPARRASASRASHVLTRPGVGASAIAAATRRRAACTRATGPPTDLRAIAGDRRRRRRPAGRRLRRHRHPARGARRACSPSRASAPACSPPAAASHARSASRPARAAAASSRAGSPYHAVRRPTGTFLGVLKVAPADRPGVAAVAEQLAGAGRARAARRLAGGARRTRPATGSRDARRCSRCDRERGDADGAARARRSTPRDAARRRTPPSSSAGARSRRDDVTALLLVGARPLRRARRRLAPALAVLGAARLAAPRSSAPAERDRRARRGPRAAQLGGQGRRRLLHHVLRLDLLEVHRALGGAARADAEPGHACSRSRSASSPRRASPTASAGA